MCRNPRQSPWIGMGWRHVQIRRRGLRTRSVFALPLTLPPALTRPKRAGECLSEDLLVAFFSDGRSPAIVAKVEAHTAECRECRGLLVHYAALSADNGTALRSRDEETASFPSELAPT